MKSVSPTNLLLLGFGALLLVLAAFVLIRIYLLSHQIGSFRTLIRVTDPKSPDRPTGLMRGYACYWQKNMAWSGLVRLRVHPDYLLPRGSLELIDQPVHNPATGTSTLLLRGGEREYEVMLSTGDYEGLVSWIDSEPPPSH